MDIVVPSLQFSNADQAAVAEVAAELLPDFPDVPLGNSPEDIAHRKALTGRAFAVMGGLTLGADLDIPEHFTRPEVPAVLIEPDPTESTDTNTLLVRGRVALIGLGRTIGRIQPSAYEDDGDEVGLVRPIPEAQKEVSSFGSEVELRPHQEVTQITDGKNRLIRVDLYKSVVLQFIRDAERPTPSRIVSIPKMLQALSEQERALLALPEFMFKIFDRASASGSGEKEQEPYIYAPLGKEGITTLDLDDTIGLTPRAHELMMKLQAMADDPSFVTAVPLVPGRIAAINNAYALHGRKPMPPTSKRLLQRTQVM